MAAKKSAATIGRQPSMEVNVPAQPVAVRFARESQ
jgi:hypothetical protein